MAKKNSEFNKGDLVKCTNSASNGYKKGQLYTVVEDSKGRPMLTGSDGISDYMNMLVSTFVKIEETATEKALRNWKKDGQKGSGIALQLTSTQT